MGIKDVFKGDKWYKPLGVSHHGGNAYEGRSGAKAVEQQRAAKVQQAKAVMKGCKKCKKLGVCSSHRKEARTIQTDGKK